MELRQARPEDAECILAWRNDPQTRAQSFSEDPIDLETHQRWFRGKLADEDCFFYILEEDGTALGQIRIDREGETGEISYALAPEARGKGLGAKLLRLAEGEAAGKVRVLTGFVKQGNVPSAKCFRRCGYREEAQGDTLRFEKEVEP